MKVYAGPFQWREDRPIVGWYPPDNTLHVLDLRPLTAQATAQNPSGSALFLSEAALPSCTPLLDKTHDNLSRKSLDAIQDQLGIPEKLNTPTLAHLIDALLGDYADPDEAIICPPLMPDHRGVLRFSIGDIGASRKCPTSGPRWRIIQKMLHAQYREARAIAGNREVHRMMLTIWQKQFGIENYEEFIPQDLPTEKPKEHETFLVDTFNRTDQTNLGTASGGFSWSQTEGSFGTARIDIVSNHGSITCNSANAVYRADQDLSSVDMSVQTDGFSSTTANNQGVVARHHASDATWYLSLIARGVPNIQTYKRVTGTYTSIATSSTTLNINVTYVLKLKVAGSTLQTFKDGTQIGSDITDTAIAGNTRAGVYGFSGLAGAHLGYVENWQATEILPPLSPAEEELPTLDEGEPAGFLQDVLTAQPEDDTLPTIDEGIPSGTLTLFSGAEAPEETMPTLDEGVPYGVLQTVLGARPLLLASAELTTGSRYSSDMKVNHPSRTYHPEVGVWGNTERGISIPPGGPIINGGELTLFDAPDPQTDVQYWRTNLDTTTQQRRRFTQKLGYEGGRESLFPVIYSGEFEDARFSLDRTTIKYKDFWSQALDAVIPNVINRNNYASLPEGFDSAYPTQIYGSWLSPPENPTGVIKPTFVGFDSIFGDLYFVSLLPCKGVVAVYRQLPDEEVASLVPEDEWHWFVEGSKVFVEMPDLVFQPTMMHLFEQQPEGTQIWIDVLGLDRRPQVGPLPAIAGEVLENAIDIITANLSLNLRVEPVDIPIDYDSWVTSRNFFQSNGLKFAMIVKESVNFRTKYSWIQADSHTHVFQNRFGKMAAAVAVESNPNRHVFTEAHDIMRYQGRSFRQKSELDIEIRQPTRSELFNTFNVQYALNAVNDQWAGSYPYVNQPDLDEYGKVLPLALQQRCIRDLATSQWSAAQRARHHALRSYRCRYSLKALTNTHNNVDRLELAELHGITHYGAPGGHWINKEVLPYYLNFVAPELRYEVESIVLALVEPPVADGSVVQLGVWAINSRVGPFFEESRRHIFGIFKKSSSSHELMAVRTVNYRDFSEMDAASFTALTNQIGSFDAHRSGNNIYVATQELVTGRVALHIFSMSSSRWTLFNEEVLDTNNTGDVGVSITVQQPSGKVVIWYQSEAEFRSGPVSPASTPDGYFRRTSRKIRQSAGAWSFPVVIGKPNSSASSVLPANIDYRGKVHDTIGRVIAFTGNRLRYIFSRTEPADVANTPDLWSEVERADGAFSGSMEFQFTGGLDYTAVHPVGQYHVFQVGDVTWAAVPILVGPRPRLYFWLDGDDVGSLDHLTPLSSQWSLQHVDVSSQPPVAVKYLNGKLHALFSSGGGSANTVAVYKYLDHPFGSLDLEPSWDGEPQELRAGPTWGALQLQMVGGEFASIAGKLWMFAFYSIGNTQTIFEGHNVTADLPIDEGYTGAEWLADHS